ncbi:MAG TPA: hypothetical protein PLD84_00345 [Chitinophagales bacterium]|nr:hypothetical protein [Chitinophagales bacterium]
MSQTAYQKNPFSGLNKQDRLAYTLLIGYYLIMLAIAFLTPGTGDDGDSVSHFLFAKHAFEHPLNFLNHWAKPLFVLLASPFAQWGFIGIKIFNVTVTTLAIFFSYRITQQLQIKNGWFVIVALCFAPMYVRLSESGLTEPLFALALAIAIWLSLRNQLLYATLLASFLPFIRSEGLVILCVFFMFLVIKKRYLLLPVLAAGHIVYSIIGWFHYKDFLWVFNKMSYAVWNSAYGSGSALTFVYGMKEFIGIPLSILFCAGSIAATVRVLNYFSNKKDIISTEELWLIYGSFYSVWISHMIFWQFGLFMSFGLIRVLIAVVPCVGIICLRGFNFLLESKLIAGHPQRSKIMIVSVITILLLNAVWQLGSVCAFDLSGNQKSILLAAEKYKVQLRGHVVYSSSGYAAVAFDYDNFDTAQYRPLQEINHQKKIADSSVVVWDDFYSNESRISLNNLLLDDRFKLLEIFQSKDCMGYPSRSAVFLYNGEPVTQWMVTDTLFTNNFESGDFGGMESDFVFAGKFACLVDASNQFSPEFAATLSNARFTLPATFRISAMFYADKIPFSNDKNARFVVSLTHDGKDYFWQSFEINNQLKNTKAWQPVSFKLTIPAPESNTDVLKIYIWNSQETRIYVDNLVVEQLAQKE